MNVPVESGNEIDNDLVGLSQTMTMDLLGVNLRKKIQLLGCQDW